ncbi:MAG: Rnase Y domain-containing protein, partial [Patescibacteria group bacterium]
MFSLDSILVLATGFGVFLIGSLLGYFIRKVVMKNKAKSAEDKAEKILQKAKAQEKEILLQAKEKSLTVLEEGKREANDRRREIQSQQQRLEQRENKFDQQLLALEDKKTKLEQQKTEIERVKARVEELKEEQISKLQSIAGLSKDQARDELFRIIEDTEKETLVHRMHKLEQVSEEEIERKAKQVISLAVQRFASSHVVDATTT